MKLAVALSIAVLFVAAHVQGQDLTGLPQEPLYLIQLPPGAALLAFQRGDGDPQNLLRPSAVRTGHLDIFYKVPLSSPAGAVRSTVYVRANCIEHTGQVLSTTFYDSHDQPHKANIVKPYPMALSANFIGSICDTSPQRVSYPLAVGEDSLDAERAYVSAKWSGKPH